MKMAFLIHGWGGNPNNAWFPWLKRNLQRAGFVVQVPQLPLPEMPQINRWVAALKKAVASPNEQTYLIGHSMGCQAIARFLESQPANVKIGGAVFVGGFFKRLTGIETEEDHAIDNHWLGTPIDLDLVRVHLNKSVAIFSDNDPFVPLDNQDDFRKRLGSEIIVEHKKGHFDEILELPSALEAVLKISK
ncbi:MAG: serine hydrolase family protein [Candidatus Aenigmarchaeota archaeon]|nr:serine hydrolase family protein [Candidatus Aenigmarchaeota archaeon]